MTQPFTLNSISGGRNTDMFRYRWPYNSFVAQVRLAESANVVSVPLYEDGTRSKLVTSVDLRCDADPDTWVLFNVALLLRNV